MSGNPDYLRDNDRLAAALNDADWIAVDTEFVRERTYFAQLCLVQVNALDDAYIVDPLADDLGELWPALLERAWILHAGRQDLEIVYQVTNQLPAKIFDTQVAAALCGYAPQLGYAGLVKELFAVELPKTQTRADWSKRPLSPKMLEYAAEDVLYLPEARDILADRLAAKDRLAWAEEDSADLLDLSLYTPDPDTAVLRLKAAKNMRGRARIAAEALSAWREEQAIRADKPRQWIMKDTVVAELALTNPANEAALAKIDGLAPGTARRWGATLIALLQGAAGGDSNYEPPGRPTEADKAALKAMQKRVGQTARELDIAPEVLAPRKELTALMSGERELRCLRGWRRPLIGEALLELVD